MPTAIVQTLLLTATLFGLSACATSTKQRGSVQFVSVEAPPVGGWREVASSHDAGRIDHLSRAWTAALSTAAAGGSAARVKAEGDLLRPDAALALPAPTPGSYRCRTVKLGRDVRASPHSRSRARGFAAFKPFFCYVNVDGEQLTVVKQTGSERPVGRLWGDDDVRRLVFLGATTSSNDAVRAYGDAAAHNLAGVVERIASFRWRLVVPRSEGTLDVLELTPVVELRPAA